MKDEGFHIHKWIYNFIHFKHFINVYRFSRGCYCATYRGKAYILWHPIGKIDGCAINELDYIAYLYTNESSV